MSTTSGQTLPHDDSEIEYVTIDELTATTPTAQTSPHEDNEVEYVTIDELTATTPTTNTSIYFSPADLNDPGQPSQSKGNDNAGFALDPIFAPSISGDDANSSPSVPLDASPQKPSRHGSVAIDRSTSGTYDLPGDSGEVYKISNRRTVYNTNETDGWFKTRTMKATMCVIVLIITATAAGVAVHFNLPAHGKLFGLSFCRPIYVSNIMLYMMYNNKIYCISIFLEQAPCKDKEEWCGRLGYLNCTDPYVLDTCQQSCGACTDVGKNPNT